MSGDLSGMFGNLMGAINQNPAALQHNYGVQGMPASPLDTVDPMLQNATKGLAGGMGLKGDFTTSHQKYAEMYKQAQAEAAAQKLAQQKYRESLAQRATGAGYTDIAERVQAGVGDLEEVAEEYNKRERSDTMERLGAPAKIAMLVNAGFTKSEAIQYSKLPTKQIEALLEGQESNLKAYQRAGGGGTNEIFKTNKYGKVLDPSSKKWVDPSDIGLVMSVPVQKVVTLDNKLNSKMEDAYVGGLIEGREAADVAAARIAEIDQARELIPDMSTGKFATVEQWAAEVGNELGMDLGDAASQQEYVVNVASEVLKRLESMKGPASDKDLAFVQEAAKGRVTMTPEALDRLHMAERRVNESLINSHRERLSRVKARGGKSLDPAAVEYFEVAEPPPPNMDIVDGKRTGGATAPTYNPKTGKWSDE